MAAITADVLNCATNSAQLVCRFVILVAGTVIYGRGDEAEVRQEEGQEAGEPGVSKA